MSRSAGSDEQQGSAFVVRQQRLFSELLSRSAGVQVQARHLRRRAVLPLLSRMRQPKPPLVSVLFRTPPREEAPSSPVEGCRASTHACAGRRSSLVPFGHSRLRRCRSVLLAARRTSSPCLRRRAQQEQPSPFSLVVLQQLRPWNGQARNSCAWPSLQRLFSPSSPLSSSAKEPAAAAFGVGRAGERSAASSFIVLRAPPSDLLFSSRHLRVRRRRCCWVRSLSSSPFGYGDELSPFCRAPPNRRVVSIRN